MAKTVKVYNGSTGSTITVYTVPASRNAAVTLASLASSSTSAASIAFGSLSGLTIPNSSTAPSAAVGAENALVAAASPSGTTPTATYPRISYLSTGQTVQITQSGGTITYSMSVVEEY